jgi:hypothetical protein
MTFPYLSMAFITVAFALWFVYNCKRSAQHKGDDRRQPKAKMPSRVAIEEQLPK